MPGIGDTNRLARPSDSSATRRTRPRLDERGDVPADRGGVGVHELGERALAERAHADEREEQDERRAVAALLGRPAP